MIKQVLEERLKNLETVNTKEHNEILGELMDFKNTVNKFIDNADNKYASKLTEKIVFGFVGLIVSGVLFAILSIVLKYKI